MLRRDFLLSLRGISLLMLISPVKLGQLAVSTPTSITSIEAGQNTKNAHFIEEQEIGVGTNEKEKRNIHQNLTGMTEVDELIMDRSEELMPRTTLGASRTSDGTTMLVAAIHPVLDDNNSSAQTGETNTKSNIVMIEKDISELLPTGQEYIYVLPTIVLFGLCGNAISLVTIFNSRLRMTSANQYLIVLTLADSMFLLFLTLILLKVDFISYYACVGIEYLLMSSSYVSSWSIVAITLERYFAIAYPLKHLHYSHSNRLKMAVMWTPIPFIFNLLQLLILVPSDANDAVDERACIVAPGQLQMILEVLDAILCYVLPCTVVVALNIVIASHLRRSRQQFANHCINTSAQLQQVQNQNGAILNDVQQQLNGSVNSKNKSVVGQVPRSKLSLPTPPSYESSSSGLSLACLQRVKPTDSMEVNRDTQFLNGVRKMLSQLGNCARKNQCKQRNDVGNGHSCANPPMIILPPTRYSSESVSSSSTANNEGRFYYNSNSRRYTYASSRANKTPRILFIVPVVYIVLNTPFYLFRIAETISVNLFSSSPFATIGSLSVTFVRLYNIAHYLYYVNFACDVVVYAFSSRNFRRTTVFVWRKILCRLFCRSQPTAGGDELYYPMTSTAALNGTLRPRCSSNVALLGMTSVGGPTRISINSQGQRQGISVKSTVGGVPFSASEHAINNDDIKIPLIKHSSFTNGTGGIGTISFEESESVTNTRPDSTTESNTQT